MNVVSDTYAICDVLHCRCDVFKREVVMTYEVEEMSVLMGFKSDRELG